MAQNVIEKIAQRHAVGLDTNREIHSGEYIVVRPAHVMTHDNTAAVIRKFTAMGVRSVANPRQPVFTLDHNIQDKSEKNREKYRMIEDFARSAGIDFYPAGRGIGHQIICEEGYAWPGTMVVASDSHANMYGGIGCLGTPVVRTDAAALWASACTWWRVPPVARVEFQGSLLPGVTGKDVIITLCGLFNNDDVLNHAVEFSGSGVESLSIVQRLTIANMTTEWGALAGVFPVDSMTVEWIRKRARFLKERGLPGVPSDTDGKGSNPRVNDERIAKLGENSFAPDEGAYYARELVLDLTTVRPHVSGPDSVKIMSSIPEIEQRNIKIDKAYLVSCVNSRVGDLAEAAAVVKGKKVAPGVEFYVAAASREVEEESRKKGDWQTLIDAGARPLPPGCGPCIGLGAGLLQRGEVGISATNRNFKGRMGSREAQAYLASPAVVAASAVAGIVTGPRSYDSPEPVMSITLNDTCTENSAPAALLDGMPAIIEGHLLYCYQDNLNTDGIFPGRYTYEEDILPEQMAHAAMENYDPAFKDIVRKGDILVGGENFGTGSSREQAATALRHSGIRMVIAASISETYMRNALNDGFIAIESPELVHSLRKTFGTAELTVRTGLKARVDFASAKVDVHGRAYRFKPFGSTAQELILDGGITRWVTRRHAR